MADETMPKTPAEMKPQIDELERIIESAGAAGSAEGEMPATKTTDEAETAAGDGASGGGADLQPLIDLGMDEAGAQAIYDAAQQMGATAGLEVDELAMMINQDVDLRMQLEKLAAGAADMAEMPAEE